MLWVWIMSDIAREEIESMLSVRHCYQDWLTVMALVGWIEPYVQYGWCEIYLGSFCVTCHGRAGTEMSCCTTDITASHYCLCMEPPHLHLTTSKVMVIVWRLRGNIIRTVLYTANVLPLQWAQLTKTVHTARFGHEFVFLCFLGCMVFLYVGVCFVLPCTVESFPFMLWRWSNKLKWAPSSFLLPPCPCGLGAGSIPLRAIVNKKQCETRGLFMLLVIHYWIGDVQDSKGVSISQNTN